VTSDRTQEDNLKKRAAARWSLISNAVLVLLKLTVGIISGSVGVLAEVVNSSADLVGAGVVYFAVRVSDEPPDQSHAYGHGKIENLSGIATATLILAGGCFAATKACWQLFHGAPLTSLGPAMGVMAFSAVVNVIVSRRLLKVGHETESPALISDGFHLQTDILTSVGVFFGLLLVKLTHHQAWDAVVALAVSVMILRMGFHLAGDAIRTLADESLSLAEEQKLEDVLRANPAVLGFHKLRTRRSGSHRHADVHVQIDDRLSFVAAHRITEDLEQELRDALPNLHPIIHMEPYEDERAHQIAENGKG